MAVSKYKWNVDELISLANRIKAENEKLMKDSTSAENIKNDISRAWQSVAGEDYIQNMAFNKETIDKMIQKLDKLKNNIERAANIYQEAEEEIASYVSAMKSNIVH